MSTGCFVYDALRASFKNKEEKEAVGGGSKSGEKEAVAVYGEKEAIAVGGEKEPVAVGGRNKAATTDERHRSVVMQGRRKKR
ncbi:hypothetical protein L2E82_15274 [Cichorium intybus]|uniref:Uncharacterized protein n=1 Tax=Cichorium intybus TaxID=13427 RepID=A0ACB9F2C9_CICIN|nr:hypothetical protein L2E82_15274 [Cichorium intybus]